MPSVDARAVLGQGRQWEHFKKAFSLAARLQSPSRESCDGMEVGSFPSLVSTANEACFFEKKKKENAFGVNQNLKKNIVTENAISNNKDVTTVHQYRLWILDIEQRGLLVSILLAWLVTGDNIRSLCLTVLKVLDTKRDGFANRLLSLVLFTSEVTLGRGENTLSRI